MVSLSTIHSASFPTYGRLPVAFPHPYIGAGSCVAAFSAVLPTPIRGGVGGGMRNIPTRLLKLLTHPQPLPYMGGESGKGSLPFLRPAGSKILC